MDIRPVNTEADYRTALKDIEFLMMAKADSSEREKLNMIRNLNKCLGIPAEVLIQAPTETHA